MKILPINNCAAQNNKNKNTNFKGAFIQNDALNELITDSNKKT